MIDNKETHFTSIDTLGEFGLIEHLAKLLPPVQQNTLKSIGDDAALLDFEGAQTLVTTDLLVENIHFDFTYTPLMHLGYKAVVVNLSDIYAMGGTPTQIVVGLAVPNRFSVEALEELYKGMAAACTKYQVDLVGGDTTSSTSGLTIAITAMGKAGVKTHFRNGAQEKDLLVVTGDLGAAYCGLMVLEREKQVFAANPHVQPDLTEYDYVLRRILKPEARKDIIEQLNTLGVTPTSMIDVSDGLSSEVLHLCKQSGLGCSVYETKLPIDPQVFKVCEEMNLNVTTIALNGGEDYELLFTIPLSDFEKIKGHPDFTVIGHMSASGEKTYLITNADQAIELSAQGWKHFNEKQENHGE